MSSESIINEDQTPSTSTPKYSAESSTTDPVSSIHNSLQELKLNSGRKLAQFTLASNILTNGRPRINLENYKNLSDLEFIEKTIELTGPNKDLELSIEKIDSDLDKSYNSVFNNSIPKTPKAPKPCRKLLPDLNRSELYNPISKLRSYTRSRSLQEDIDETYKHSYNTLENLNKIQNKQKSNTIAWRSINTNKSSIPNIKSNNNKMSDITKDLAQFLNQIPLFYGDKSSKKCFTEFTDFVNSCQTLNELFSEDTDKKFFLTSLKLRIKGDAQNIIKDIKYEKLEDLLQPLRAEYAPDYFFEDLQTELRFIKQNSDEDISSFIRRLDDCLRKCNKCAKIILPAVNIEIVNEKLAAQSLRYGIKDNTIKQQIIISKEQDYKKLKDEALLLERAFKQQEHHDKLVNNTLQEKNTLEETNKLLLELLNKRENTNKPKENTLEDTNKLIKDLLSEKYLNENKTEYKNNNQQNKNFDHTHENSYRQTNMLRPPNRFSNSNRNFQSNNNYRGQNNYNYNYNNKNNNNNDTYQNTESYQQKQNFQRQQNSNRNQIICYKCNETGHLTRDCRSRNFNPFCRNCKKYGHNDQNCQNRNLNTSNINSIEIKSELICQLCNNIGHIAGKCEQFKEIFRNTQVCDFCELRGHSDKECKMLKKAENRFKSEN